MRTCIGFWNGAIKSKKNLACMYMFIYTYTNMYAYVHTHAQMLEECRKERDDARKAFEETTRERDDDARTAEDMQERLQVLNYMLVYKYE